MYDYVIAGGGSAGCVLAARLSECGAKVLLLEAGYPDTHPYIHVPAGFTRLSGPRVNWGYRTVPQKHLDNRELWYPQGRTLGGGSSINAMIYTRGQAEDYDAWAALGNEGWAYRDVLPYFRRAERNQRFADKYHGIEGPLAVSDPISPIEITRTFIKAAQQVGVPFNPDFNGATQGGVGFHQTTTRDGRRGSAAVSYLRPARGRPNLMVRTRTMVTRILFEGTRAIGVEYAADGRTALERALAGVETIVASGAIGSPKLLMISGLGPAGHLREKDIAVVLDLPGVGENLQDHIDCYTAWDCSGPYSYYGTDQYLRQAWWALQYALFRNGPATSNIVEAGAFVRVDPESKTPDTQLHFLPAYVIDHGLMRLDGYGVSLYANLLRPRSRGTVRLASADPKQAPLIDPNFLADPYDRKMAVEGIRFARSVMAAPAFRPFIKSEHMPGADKKTDADIEGYCRQWGKTDYHPVGTCKMGVDPLAVVDPELKVRGIERLRVTDSSIMPLEISANTNAPSIMIAEKAADMILASARSSARKAA
jgi:choline dehydrogenase-like flavoprotein